MNKRQRKKLIKKEVMDYFMKEFPALKNVRASIKFSKKKEAT